MRFKILAINGLMEGYGQNPTSLPASHSPLPSCSENKRNVNEDLRRQCFVFNLEVSWVGCFRFSGFGKGSANNTLASLLETYFEPRGVLNNNTNTHSLAARRQRICDYSHQIGRCRKKELGLIFCMQWWLEKAHNVCIFLFSSTSSVKSKRAVIYQNTASSKYTRGVQDLRHLADKVDESCLNSITMNHV